MKFEQNKINLYLGAGYLILGIVSIFSLIQERILLGLSVAGLMFSLSLLALAVENTLLPKEKLAKFATDRKNPSLLENVQQIRQMLEKKPKNKDTLHWVQLAGGISFMAGFVCLVAIPGFGFSTETIAHINAFCYVTSIGVVFIAFYLEEKQTEKTQQDGEKEIVNFLFDQLEEAIAKKQDPAPEPPAPAEAEVISLTAEPVPEPAAVAVAAEQPEEAPVQEAPAAVEVTENLPAPESEPEPEEEKDIIESNLQEMMEPAKALLEKAKIKIKSIPEKLESREDA